MSASTNGPERYSRSDQTTGRRLELWVRPGTRQAADDLVAQAESLAADGTVETVDVRVWDAHQNLSSSVRSHRQQEARATLQRLKRWAWRHGAELVGFGTRRRAGRGRLGPEYVIQRVPPVLLAEYEDGLLVNVAPCSDRDRCVTERLERLSTMGAEARYPLLPR